MHIYFILILFKYKSYLRKLLRLIKYYLFNEIYPNHIKALTKAKLLPCLGIKKLTKNERPMEKNRKRPTYEKLEEQRKKVR